MKEILRKILSKGYRFLKETLSNDGVWKELDNMGNEIKKKK